MDSGFGSFMASIMPTVDSLKTVMAVKGSAILTQENIDICKEFLATPEYLAIAAQYGADQFVKLPLHLLIANPVLVIPKSFHALMNYANGLFILPLLAAFSQFFMTKVTSPSTPKKEGETSSEQEAAQNAMNSGFMKWFFPLFSLWICAGYNAAFAIYWMAANVIQIVQQVCVNAYFNRVDRIAAEKEKEENSEI